MSILLSTRQKNWLSTPQKEKQVSFQLQKGKQESFQLHNNSNNLKNAAMAKSRNNSDNRDSSSDKKKKVEKSSGIQPFLFTPEEW